MENGLPQHGTLSPRETNFWNFNADAGASVVLRMAATTLNPKLQLFSPSGQLLGTAGSGNAGFTDADLSMRLTNSGAFTVAVSAYSGTNDYVLTMALVPGAFSVQAGGNGGDLRNGWKQTAALSRGELDMWSFAANAGDGIVLRLGATNYNPWIRLFGPDGAPVGSAGSPNAGFMDADLAVQATNNGTFVVVVSSIAVNGAGPYTLSLSRSGAQLFIAPGDEGGTLTNGWKYKGSIEPGDLDPWQFQAAAGDAIVLRMGATNFNPSIRLYGPNGARVGIAGSGNTGFTDVDLAARATNSGTFTVVASSETENGRGAYTLSLAQSGAAIYVTPGDEGGTLTNGWRHTGALEAGDLDVWGFTATAGDAIVIRMGAMDYNPYLRLYNLDGSLLASSGTGNGGFTVAEVATRATNSGSFMLVAASFVPNGTGPYVLSLAKTGSPILASPDDESGTIPENGEETGAIPYADIDIWNVMAVAGTILSFDLEKLVDDGGFTPWLRIYGPDGQLLKTGFSSSSFTLKVTTTHTGLFTAVVADASQSRTVTGTYKLQVDYDCGPLRAIYADDGQNNVTVHRLYRETEDLLCVLS